MNGIIIGGGIGGLCLHIALKQAGIPTKVYEAVNELQTVGAGILLAPNAMQVMDRLGLAQKLMQAGKSIGALQLTDYQAYPIGKQPPDSVWERYGFENVAIHRAALQKVLADEVGDALILGKRCQQVRDLAEGNAVEVVFEDGELVRADFVIGADGIHSKVRESIEPHVSLRYSGQTCWRGIVDFRFREGWHWGGMELWGKQARFGFARISEKQVYWFAVQEAEANGKDAPQTIKSDLLALFRGFAYPASELIEATDRQAIIRNDIVDFKPIRRWHTGNICLMGDAAHAMTPNMGQGGSQAIEDAYFLAREMRRRDIQLAFERFQVARFKKVQQIIQRSWQIGKLAHISWGQGLRNMVLRLMPESFVLKQLDELYRLDD